MTSFLDPRLPDRFWAKCIPEPNSGCWLWFGATVLNGYGSFHSDSRMRAAHRVAFETLIGETDGLYLDHLCRVRCCVNPAHLEPVTNRENVLRGTGPTSDNAKKTHCKHGHEFTPANTYVSRNGRRHCRECNRAEVQRSKLRRRRPPEAPS